MGGLEEGVEVILGKVELRVGDLVLGEDGEAMFADEEVRDVLLKLLFRSFKHGLQLWQHPSRKCAACR